jgi:hypothetical protein
MIDVLKHEQRRKSKPRDPDQRAERVAKHQRKTRVEQVREHELTYDYDERPTGGRESWGFPLGGWAGF